MAPGMVILQGQAGDALARRLHRGIPVRNGDIVLPGKFLQLLVGTVRIQGLGQGDNEFGAVILGKFDQLFKDRGFEFGDPLGVLVLSSLERIF